MSTLPMDNNVDCLSDDPRQRAPLVLGHEQFDTVTSEIPRCNEAARPPRAWTICFVFSVGLMTMLMALVGYLIVTGVGVWGNNNPVMWGFPIVNFVFWVGIGHGGEEAFGFRGSALGVQRGTQQHPGFQMIGDGGQDLPVKRLCLGETARVVMGRGLFHGTNWVHRSISLPCPQTSRGPKLIPPSRFSPDCGAGPRPCP